MSIDEEGLSFFLPYLEKINLVQAKIKFFLCGINLAIIAILRQIFS